MAKFNTDRFKVAGGLLNDVSKQAATPRPEEMQIVYKSIQELVPHKENNYSLSSIQELADNIKIVGRIQQPIVYLDPPLEDGRNKIIAGHRRYEAYLLLKKENDKWGDNIPCTPVTLDHVQLPISDESKEKYLILTTNIDNRNKTDADILFEFREQKAIYEEAKENGFVLTGKMRHLLAKDLNLSPAQVGKIEYIEKNASDPVKEALSENDITIAQANEIAHKTVEEQQEIITKIKEVNTSSTDGTSSGTEQTPKSEVQKVIKPKIIDNLDQDHYDVNFADQISDITKDLDDLKKYNVVDTLSKKDYAKFLTTKEKIKEQVKKLEQMIKIITE